MIRDEQIAYLQIRTWIGYSPGAVHYYGELVCDRASVDLSYVMSERDARELRKAHDWRHYKAGSLSTHFTDRDKLVKLAIETYKTHFPGALVLVEGRSSVCDPQLVLDAPEDFKLKVNALFDEGERIDGYEGDEKRMDEIFKEYQSYLKDYVVSV